MSQLFNVVKCFQCSAYQVDINKKSTNKWDCKLCGIKQSLKQIFFQGTSKDCRERVKKLGELQCIRDQEKDNNALNQFINKPDCFDNLNSFSNINQNNQVNTITGSKWDIYLSDKDKEEIYRQKNPINDEDENFD